MGVRHATDYPEDIERILYRAWATGKRVAVLGCSSFIEADALTGRDLSNITVVETDAAAILRVKQHHGHQIVIEQQSNVEFLRSTVEARECFDLIYSLTLLQSPADKSAEPCLGLIRQALKPDGAVYLWNGVETNFGSSQNVAV